MAIAVACFAALLAWTTPSTLRGDVDFLDVEEPGVLVDVASAIASPDREVVLVVTAGDDNSVRMADACLSQLHALGIDAHTIVVTDEVKSCSRLGKLHRAKCLWSSRVLKRAPARSTSMDKFWDGRFRFYAAKKAYLASLVRQGFRVFQSDADAVFARNPLPVFRSLPSNCSVVVQTDGPIANAGMMYARPGTRASQRLLDEVAWRIQLFQHRPSTIERVVRFATTPYYANSDDQTILNDAIVSFVTGNRTFLGAQARFEAKNSHNRHATFSWTSLPEYQEWKRGITSTWKRSRQIAWTPYRVNGTKIHSRRKHHVVGFPFFDEPRDYVCLAPHWLISHMPHTPKNYVTHLARARGMTAKMKALSSVTSCTGCATR